MKSQEYSWLNKKPAGNIEETEKRIPSKIFKDGCLGLDLYNAGEKTQQT